MDLLHAVSPAPRFGFRPWVPLAPHRQDLPLIFLPARGLGNALPGQSREISHSSRGVRHLPELRRFGSADRRREGFEPETRSKQFSNLLKPFEYCPFRSPSIREFGTRFGTEAISLTADRGRRATRIWARQPHSLSTGTGDQRASAVNYANEYEAVIAEPLPARSRGAKENGHEIGPDVFCHRGNSGRLQATKIG